jgi:hypothetical protein
MRQPKRYANLALALASMIACLLVFETALRFTSYKNLLNKDQYLRYYYQADPEKGFDIRPNVAKIRLSVDHGAVQYDIWSNELGCYDRPYNGEKDLVLLVGDSFTHSYAPFENKWGTQIESLLHYRVLKCGVSGYGTRQEYFKARDVIAKTGTRPNLVVVGYFLNDLADDYSFPSLMVIDGFLVPTHKYQHLVKANADPGRTYNLWKKLRGDHPLSLMDLAKYHLGRHSILSNLMDEVWARLFPQRYSFPLPNSFLAFQDEPWIKEKGVWENHQANLKHFQELAQDNGSQLLVVLIPANTQVYPFLVDWGKFDAERPNRILGKFFQEEKINYLDLLPLFKQYADQTPRPGLSSDRDLYWAHNSHFSLKGERLAALLVARHILEHDLLKVEEKDSKLVYIREQLKNFH